jgi:hypothetical protein
VVSSGRHRRERTRGEALPRHRGPVRESTESWREVLLDLKRRGVEAPALAVGGAAGGFPDPGAMPESSSISGSPPDQLAIHQL